MASLNLTPEQEANPNLKQAAESLTAALASLRLDLPVAQSPHERRLRNAAADVLDLEPIVAVQWARYRFLEQGYLHIPAEFRGHSDLPYEVRGEADVTFCPRFTEEPSIEKMLLTHVTDALRSGEEYLGEGSADEAILAVEIGKYFIEQVEGMLRKCEESVVAHEKLLESYAAAFPQAVIASPSISLTTRQICCQAFITDQYANAVPPQQGRLQELEQRLQAAWRAVERQDLFAVLPMIGGMAAEVGALVQCMADLAEKLTAFRELARTMECGQPFDQHNGQDLPLEMQMPLAEKRQKNRARRTRGHGKRIPDPK
ncbi:hypothetical protein LTR86_004653 [Recurvomyces mirabilis]|nr:hypothetical protein LTR86_004653 [Recurvomyces mirabilis]